MTQWTIQSGAAGGMVRRRRHPTDQRAVLVKLTAAGTAVAVALAQDYREFAALLFDRVPDQDLVTFAGHPRAGAGDAPYRRGLPLTRRCSWLFPQVIGWSMGLWTAGGPSNINRQNGK